MNSGSEILKIINDSGDVVSIESAGAMKVVRYNGVTYSKLNSNSVYTGSYWDYLSLLAAVPENPNILMIGLAGGTVAYQISKLFDRFNLDVVEVDRKMKIVADEFLHNSAKYNLIIDNGLEYVKRTKAKYDLIISDAFINNRIIPGFVEEPFLTDSYNALNDNGILAINYILSLPELLKLRIGELIRKLKSHYGKVYRINLSFWDGNTILLGSKTADKAQILRRISNRISIGSENAKVISAISKMKEL